MAFVDYYGEFTKLRQKGYANDEYQKVFMKLSHKVQGLLGKFLTSCFISERASEIRAIV